MTPVVSVLIVSYRSREVLGPCLESLAACARRVPLEVVVVDNASPDGTDQWAAEHHPWVHLIRSPRNRGYGGGLNRAAAVARGQLFLVLNPDCVVAPAELERLIAELRRSPGVAAAAPRLLDGAGHPVRSCGRFPNLWTLICDHLGLARACADTPWFGGYKYGGRDLASLDRVDWVSGAAMLIPRSVWRVVGGFDENIFLYMEEVDWCRRAAARGYPARFVPGATFVHTGQHASRQAPREPYLHNLRSRVYYFRKHGGPATALAAKAILFASLALKWLVAGWSGRHREAQPTYAAGLSAVARADWR